MLQRARAFVCHPRLANRVLATTLFALFVALMEHSLVAVAFFQDEWAVWWPTGGVILALLLLSRRRAWPWIFLGATLGTWLGPFSRDQPFADFAKNSVCNLLEGVIPALMLPRFETLTAWLMKPRLARTFILYALIIGPCIGGGITAAYTYARHYGAPIDTGIRWAVADSLGIAMYTPLALAVISAETYRLFHHKELAGTIGTLSLLLVSAWFIFHQSVYPIAYAVFPVMLLVALRTGFSGSVLAINLLAPIVAAATLHGNGPFAMISGEHETYRIIILQFFLILILLMALPISVSRVQQFSTTAQLQLAYERMEALAAEDGLTGLPNRRCFDTTLQAEWRRAARARQPLALLLLDVDHFKAYNDIYGHPAGDVCLQQVAAAIRNVPQRASDLVARYGGEEFVVLLPGIDIAGASRLAELLCVAVRDLHLTHERSGLGQVTISVGCSGLQPGKDLNPQTLTDEADKALYHAKRAGRNCASTFSQEIAAADLFEAALIVSQ